MNDTAINDTAMKNKAMDNRSTTTAAAFFVLACAMPAGSQAASYYYEAVTRSEDPRGRSAHTSTVRGWIDGTNARIEYQDADQSGLFAAGSYLLTTDGGATLYLVNPSSETISEMDLDAMFGMVGNVMNAVGGLMNMEFTDFVNERVTERADEPILGYPTTYYQYNTGYTMNMSVLGIRRETRSQTEQHFWCASGLDADGFGVWLRPDRFRTGNEELDTLISQEYGAIDCLPLRTRTVMTTTDGRGRDATSTTSMEVTVLREETMSAGTFELPADYEHVPLLANVPEELRQMMEQQGQTPESEPARPEESGGRRPRLRDLPNR